MSEFNDLVARYAADLKEKCGVDADVDLLTQIARGLGPSIYNGDSSTVSASDEGELNRVKDTFLIKKLGLTAGPDLDAGLNQAIDTYGRSNRRKLRVSLYYLLVKQFGKEAVFA